MALTKTELTLKNNLKYLRELSNLSIRQLAKIIEIDYSYYYRIENPERTVAPRFQTLEKIAEYYNIPVYCLFHDNLSQILNK